MTACDKIDFNTLGKIIYSDKKKSAFQYMYFSI